MVENESKNIFLRKAIKGSRKCAADKPHFPLPLITTTRKAFLERTSLSVTRIFSNRFWVTTDVLASCNKIHYPNTKIDRYNLVRKAFNRNDLYCRFNNCIKSAGPTVVINNQ